MQLPVLGRCIVFGFGMSHSVDVSVHLGGHKCLGRYLDVYQRLDVQEGYRHKIQSLLKYPNMHLFDSLYTFSASSCYHSPISNVHFWQLQLAPVVRERFLISSTNSFLREDIHLRKRTMEPENTPLEKEKHQSKPPIFGFQPKVFWGVLFAPRSVFFQILCSWIVSKSY